MTDDKRLADTLRAKGFLYRQADDHSGFVLLTDDEVLRATEGTCFRAGVELDLACQDLWNEILKQFGKVITPVLFAVGRFIRWLRGGKNDTGTSG